MASDLALFRGASGVERARAIIERMAALEIPTTPANYEVWAAYVSGVQPDLNREIDAHLAGGQRFTDDFNEAVHERFFANTRLSFQMLETSETIARELGDVESSLRGAGERAGSYATVLLNAANGLQAGLAPGAFRDLVEQVGSATREVAANNRMLAEQMEASSRQINELKAALQSVKVEALTDGLTGLANRRMFDETLQKRLLECTVDTSDLCVLLFDIDHFARINEVWGRAIGDQVIRYVASVLREHANGDVLAARHGGEEFAMIMPRTGLDLAEAVAARVGRAVKSKQLSRKSTGDTIGAVTVSVGIARYKGPENASDLLARAEASLLAAKGAGRDCITTDAQLGRLSAA